VFYFTTYPLPVCTDGKRSTYGSLGRFAPIHQERKDNNRPDPNLVKQLRVISNLHFEVRYGMEDTTDRAATGVNRDALMRRAFIAATIVAIMNKENAVSFVRRYTLLILTYVSSVVCS